MDTEREMFETQRERSKNRLYVSFAAIGAIIILGLWLGSSYFENKRKAIPPKFTAESCKEACGALGVVSIDDTECKCNAPPRPQAMRCTCE